jgi:hypothetical protein
MPLSRTFGSPPAHTPYPALLHGSAPHGSAFGVHVGRQVHVQLWLLRTQFEGHGFGTDGSMDVARSGRFATHCPVSRMHVVPTDHPGPIAPSPPPAGVPPLEDPPLADPPLEDPPLVDPVDAGPVGGTLDAATVGALEPTGDTAPRASSVPSPIGARPRARSNGVPTSGPHASTPMRANPHARANRSCMFARSQRPRHERTAQRLRREGRILGACELGTAFSCSPSPQQHVRSFRRHGTIGHRTPARMRAQTTAAPAAALAES